MAARLIGARFGEPKIMKAMNIFVWTNDGFQETLVREAQIVVDYYGPGKHERLDVATELGLDRQYSIITALIAEP